MTTFIRDVSLGPDKNNKVWKKYKVYTNLQELPKDQPVCLLALYTNSRLASYRIEKLIYMKIKYDKERDQWALLASKENFTNIDITAKGVWGAAVLLDIHSKGRE